MYTEQDLIEIVAQKKKRLVLLSIPCALLLVALVYFVFTRNELGADAATILLGFLLIAGLDLFIKPLHRYEIHLRNVLHDLTRTLDCEYSSVSDDLSEVDGVLYRTVTVITYDEKNRPFDRIFYFDVQKTFPTLTPGQRVRVTFHDRELAAIRCI